MIYDLIVIGAGPTGCAAAITAAKNGASVLLLERGRFPRHKVCGEFVSAESLELLESLLAPEHHALIQNAPRINHARIFADGAEIPAEISPAAASIARYDLDSALWNSALESGIKTREDCVVTSVQGRGPFQVSTKDDLFEARALINATGRWSTLTSQQTRSQAAKDRWIGVKSHYREANASASVDLYFFSGGYCGVQPVYAPRNGEKTVINACAMVNARVAADLDDVLQLHPQLSERSRSWEKAMEPVSTSPLVFHQPEPLQDKMLQAGDSATFVDPFIGDGISLALQSGALAAKCLIGFFAKRESLDEAVSAYSKRYLNELAPVFRNSSKLRRVLAWPGVIRKPVMALLENTPFLTRRLVQMTR